MKLSEVAKRYSISDSTLTSWCKRGEVEAIQQPYGTKITYLIGLKSLEERLTKGKRVTSSSQELIEPLIDTLIERLSNLLPGIREAQQDLKAYVSYSEAMSNFKLWEMAMKQGLMSGRAFSKGTIEAYTYYIEYFLEEHKEISINALKKELLFIPVEQFGKREKLYKAVVCFSKFLISENLLYKTFLDEVKPLTPKRHRPPKRHSINEVELDTLLNHCISIRQRVTVLFLATTGLRASEFCDLKWEDIDFSNYSLVVKCGKGGKVRRVGFGDRLARAILEYRSFCIQRYGPKEHAFLDKHGEQMDRYGLRNLLDKLGKRAGIHLSPHVLRRAFVTHNANKGRPMNMIQIAAGHSSITTTMKYCRTTESEVVEAMKGWD